MEPAFFMGEEMSEEQRAGQRNATEECAAQLSSAAQALEQVIGKLEAQYAALNQKIDRIIATVEKADAGDGEPGVSDGVQAGQVTRLQQENRELRQRVGRKTLVPLVSTLLALNFIGDGLRDAWDIKAK